MLVQNQTTFSASHVQAYWAHLDHVVYKNEVSEHEKSSTSQLLKNSKDGSQRVLSLAVDTERQLEVGVVAIHSLGVPCFASHD